MSTGTDSMRLTESLQRAVGYWQSRKKVLAGSSNATLSSIALSRQAGTDGGSVALEIGKRVGWPVYDHELLERIAADIGVRTQLLESIDERGVNWLQESFERMTGTPIVAESIYVHHLVKVVLALGAHGECVIVGRGAAFILPAASTLRVRLVAPLEHRAAALSQRLGLSDVAARAKAVTQDKERASFVREHFHHDPEAPDQFDLVLNTARFSAGDCADLVLECLRRRQNSKVTGAGL